jgi:uncharacterized protein YqhQ
VTKLSRMDFAASGSSPEKAVDISGHKHRCGTVFLFFRNFISKLIVYFVQLLIDDSLTFQ